MTQNLLSHHLDPASMPLVFQYNKRDLPQVLEIEALDRALNARRAEAIPAVAVRGEGRPRDVRRRSSRGRSRTSRAATRSWTSSRARPARQWAEEARPPAVRTRPRLDRATRGAARHAAAADSRRPAPAPARRGRAGAPTRRRLRRHRRRPHRGRGWRRAARAGEDCPSRARRGPRRARASSSRPTPRPRPSSASALTELREERDVARQRLDDLRQTDAAPRRSCSTGTPLDAALGPVLAPDGPHRGRRPRRVLGAAARRAAAGRRRCWGCARDPVLGIARRAAPRLGDAARGRDAGLRACRRRTSTSGRRSTGPRGSLRRAARGALPHAGRAAGCRRLLLRARTPRARVPTPSSTSPRSRARSRSRSSWSATLHTVRAAERALELALAGTASLRGLEGVVRSIEQLRDRLGEIRGRPDAPPWFPSSTSASRPRSRLRARGRPVAPRVQPRRDPPRQRLPRGPARRAADAGGDGRARPGGRDRARPTRRCCGWRCARSPTRCARGPARNTAPLAIRAGRVVRRRPGRACARRARRPGPPGRRRR